MTMPTLPDALRMFWTVGIVQVSPGALGMVHRRVPYIRAELETFVAATPGIRWEGRDWIVRCEVTL